MTFMLFFFMSIILVELFSVMDLRGSFRSTLALSKEALHVLTSPEMDDHQKEVFMRRKSLEILKITIFFIGKFFVIFLVLFFVYTLAVQLLPVSREAFIEGISSPLVLLTLSGVTLCYVWVRKVIRQRLQSR